MLFTLKSLRLFCLILIPIVSTSQVITPNTFNNVYIRSGGFMTIFGHHNFMKGSGFLRPGIVRTARVPTPGTLNYAKDSSWSGASESQYVDGYVKSFHESDFTFPIGHDGFYRPISLSKAYSSSAAYSRKNPLDLSKFKSNEIGEISTKEYWTIHLHQATKVTLTWAYDSDVTDILNNNQSEILSIAGLNTTTNQWELIPSDVDEYTLDVSVHNSILNPNTKSKPSVGSITTNDEVLIDTYSHFTIASLASNVLYDKPQISIYPNPQLVGSEIMMDYKMTGDTGHIKVYKSDNSLLYSIDLIDREGKMALPYPIAESGSYILGITDSKGNTSFQNLILVDN